MSQKEKCAMKIENLYRMLRGEIAPPDSAFVIKDILDTEKCKEWHDLATIREATAEQLLKTLPSASLEVACRDDKVCSYVVAEYATWYRKAVYRALPFWTRARYWRKDHADEIGWALTIGSAFAGGAMFGRFGGLVSGVVASSVVKSTKLGGQQEQ
jgi:hypothetical protein